MEWSKIIILIVVFVLGVLGNGVVIWATGFKMKKTVSTVWYLNLAVADFLATAFLPLVITWIALDGYWPFGWFMCKMEAMVFHANMYANSFTLAVISVDRCLCAVWPVWFRNHRTVRKASWVSLGVWVLALALSSGPFIFRDTETWSHGDDGDDDVQVFCYDNYALAADWNHTLEEIQLAKLHYGAMVVTPFLVAFVVPFSIIISSYSVIYRLRNTNRSLASQWGRPCEITATVIGAFTQCWAPYHITSLIALHVHTTETQHSDILMYILFFYYHTSHSLTLAHSCLKPLLYLFIGQGQRFKEVFRGSILKVLEQAFSEEPPQTNDTPTDPDATNYIITLSDTEGSTGKAFAYNRF